jgi:hypothetical protein
VHTFRRENWGRMSALRLGGKGQALLGGAGRAVVALSATFASGFDLSFCKAALAPGYGVGLRVMDLVAEPIGHCAARTRRERS